jgi:hypothetical protein
MMVEEVDTYLMEPIEPVGVPATPLTNAVPTPDLSVTATWTHWFRGIVGPKAAVFPPPVWNMLKSRMLVPELLYVVITQSWYPVIVPRLTMIPDAVPEDPVATVW